MELFDRVGLRTLSPPWSSGSEKYSPADVGAGPPGEVTDVGVVHSDDICDMSLDIFIICSTVGTLPAREWLDRAGRGGVSVGVPTRIMPILLFVDPEEHPPAPAKDPDPGGGQRAAIDGSDAFF